MKIKKEYRPEECVSTDKDRPILQKVSIDTAWPGAPLAVATDGRMLVTVPVTDVGPTESGHLIKPKYLRHARGCCGHKNPDAEVRVTNRSVVCGPTIFMDPDLRHDHEYRFPNWRSCFTMKTAPTKTVCLDAGLLHKLATAMGSQKVKITFYDDVDPVEVRPVDALNTARGLLMPVRES